MERYDHKNIESKWQKQWNTDKQYLTPDTQEGADNFYALVEFPYPSGNLHIGHWYAFTVPDMYARFMRMQGKNVLFPIGFDSFGLPAENAAIKHGLDPKVWTEQNMAQMQTQLERMGASFDWSRFIRTSDPETYAWTQWIFTEMFKKGLAYKAETVVNWCPSCQTVLANEQVTEGACERCGSVVEKKKQKQWMLKITDYAEKLLDGLDTLEWPEEIKEQQRNWIGKSEGAEITFSISDSEFSIPVFTTRPDTLFGVTYIVLAPEHPYTKELARKASNTEDVEHYIATALKKSDLERQTTQKEKTGVRLEGITAINPATNEEIPVFVADYVLASYGTGAVMAVPAHDERDYAFAQKFDVPVRQVVTASSTDTQKLTEAYVGDGVLINSNNFDGLSSQEAKQKITEHVSGEITTTYRLRDWSVGRQRYWGTPIPIVYDPDGAPHPVPQEHLPWTLPEDVDHTPTGEPPLAKSQELHERTEKIFGKGWKPEVETMDTFIDSSWYFLRYLDPQNNENFASKEKQQNWMPVDFYMGGSEHTTLHLLYSRFFQKVLHDLGHVTESEPFRYRLNRGLILGPDGMKMSKSKGNVVNPDEVVERVGADTVRMYLAFIGPYAEAGSYPWDLGGIAGIRRFLERVYALHQNTQETTPADTERLLHQTIQKVTKDMHDLKFNTAISALMVFINTAEKTGVSESDMSTFVRLLAPMAPHVSEDMWHALGNTASVHSAEWPSYDEEKVQESQVTIAVQVDGKVRETFTVARDMPQDELLALVSASESLQKWLGSAYEVKKIIPGKLISIVTQKA